MKTHHLFLSHSWQYGDAYDRLLQLLRARPRFLFKNYSVPKDDPVHNAGTDVALKRAIKRQMAPCGVVLVIAGVYATYSKWIKIELDLALKGFETKKPVIAIEPWGAERSSHEVKQSADRVVRWNTESIVKAIREVSA